MPAGQRTETCQAVGTDNNLPASLVDALEHSSLTVARTINNVFAYPGNVRVSPASRFAASLRGRVTERHEAEPFVVCGRERRIDCNRGIEKGPAIQKRLEPAFHLRPIRVD